VLVVEDEPVIGYICKKTLSNEGFEVDIALNGLLAMEMVQNNMYDLCLTDIRTPEMNGIELFAYLEEEHPDLARNVIFTTGDILSGNIEEFLDTAGRLFLPKPFTPEELREVVASHAFS
jgi:CheY-like chemotaxis protein